MPRSDATVQNPDNFRRLGECPWNCRSDNCFNPGKATCSGGNEDLTQICTCDLGGRSAFDMAMYAMYYDKTGQPPAPTFTNRNVRQSPRSYCR